MSLRTIPNSIMDNDHPDPEVQERAKRRIFSLSYKTNILRITDDLPRGESAGFLRKEALYWAQLQTWRKQREDGTLGEPKKRGRKAAGAEASNAQLAQLRRENGTRPGHPAAARVVAC